MSAELKAGAPAIDFAAAGGVDRARLERSLALHGERVGYGRYHFTGGREPHWVDLYTAAFPRCDCADHLWRDAICKHILAALIREGNEHIIGEVGRLVAGLRAA
ncbi:MAG TPA: SWIM zinc finger family protein [Gemmatimonadaceae bacterium]